ncbi:hypothetical protein MACH21_11580 [Roseicyclus marinus]|uniref:Uncharacterized protein n=1 Tax=Roseicyclus marinus TaxID=2161673 RepID=A0AA48HIT3_9RHOB|nr:hypothetical protein MACH21_11580 [Roseicyclus marinus]
MHLVPHGLAETARAIRPDIERDDSSACRKGRDDHPIHGRNAPAVAGKVRKRVGKGAKDTNHPGFEPLAYRGRS